MVGAAGENLSVAALRRSALNFQSEMSSFLYGLEINDLSFEFLCGSKGLVHSCILYVMKNRFNNISHIL